MTKYVDYLESARNHEYKAPTMMVYDLFRGHLENSVKKKFCEKNEAKPLSKGIFHLKITNLQEIAPVFHLKIEKIEFFRAVFH